MRRALACLSLLAVTTSVACRPTHTVGGDDTQTREPEPAEVAPAAPLDEREHGAAPRHEPAPSSAPAAAPSCPGDSSCPASYEPLSLGEDELKRIRRVQTIVARAAAEYGLDPNLVNAVIWVESKFNPRARGPAGARGMMQLMPRTSQSLAKKLKRPHQPYNPEFNIFAGTYYLAQLVETFDGDEHLALAGYSRGAGRVKAIVASGEPLPEGTRRFIHKIMRAKATFEAIAASRSSS